MKIAQEESCSAKKSILRNLIKNLNWKLELGISTKMEDMKYVSKIRGYDEINKEPKLYDLNRVKLRVDFSIENYCNELVPHYSIFSQTVYNKGNGNYKDVLIKDIFSASGNG